MKKAAISWTAIMYVLTIVILFSVIALQYRAITLYRNEMGRMSQDGLSEYVLYSFHSPLTAEEQDAIEAVTEYHESKINIIVPVSVCSACLMSLLSETEVAGFGKDDVHVTFAQDDVYFRQELKVRGFGNISIDESLSEQPLYDILISSKSKNEWQGLSMRYKEGFDEALRLLLSNTPKN